MGSYNATCGVTNTTISYGDRVVAFKVLPITAPDGRSRSYFDSIASPYFAVSFAVRGIYSDYGNFRPDDAGELANAKFLSEKIKDNDE